MNKNVIILGKECNNNSIPEFIYRDLNNKNSMQYKIVQENSNDWKIYFYESGTLTFLQNKPEYLDVFLVGGGASGNAGANGDGTPGSGGAGGFTSRGIIRLDTNINEYTITIGEGGIYAGTSDNEGSGDDGKPTSAFGLTANGGIAGKKTNNYISSGGSGGGGYSRDSSVTDTSSSNNEYGANGGKDGNNGSGQEYIGLGQGFTTREFYESKGKLYAGGGGGASSQQNKNGGIGGEGGGGNGSNSSNDGVTAGKPNTGGGGGGSNNGTKDKKPAGNGGSGIVVIRNLRNS